MLNINSEIETLKEDLQEMLDKSEIILGYKSGGTDQIMEDLLNLNIDKSNQLVIDILETENDLNILYNYREEIITDNPFNTLYNEDEDLE